MAAAAAAALLSGCASTIADNIPVVGLPAGTPERPATQAEYPAVHDMPPRRADTPLSTDEQQKLQKELIEARDGQGKRADAIAEAEPARKPVVAQKNAQKKKAAPARTQAAGSSQNP
jgi:hypothetical protein